VELEVRAEREASVLVDPVRIRQALDNLIDNALRHTPRGGRVTIRGERSNGTVRVTVSDTGAGFSSGMLERAFEPFAAGADGSGHGLGLAIVRVIAVAHGGDAAVANGDERGASVTMRLPA